MAMDLKHHKQMNMLHDSTCSGIAQFCSHLAKLSLTKLTRWINMDDEPIIDYHVLGKLFVANWLNWLPILYCEYDMERLISHSS